MVKKCLSKICWYLVIAFIWAIGNLYLIENFNLKNKYLGCYKWLNKDGLLKVPNWWLIVIPLGLIVLGLISKTTWQRFKIWGDRVGWSIFLLFCFGVSHYIALVPYIDESYISNFLLIIAYSFYGLFIVSVERGTSRRIEEEKHNRDYIGNDKLDQMSRIAALLQFIKVYRYSSISDNTLVVGVRGGWGAGKTYFMRMLEQNFWLDKSIVSVWFDPWKYNDFGNLKVGLLNEIVTRLNGERSHGFLKFTMHMGKWFPYFDKLLKVLPSKYSFLGDLTLLLIKDSGDFEKRKKRISSSLKDYKNDEEQEIKIVVFVDDLDRTNPTLVSEFFGNLNQLLNIKGICYVLGLESGQIINAIDKSGFKDGELYLEKIIDRNVYLKPSIETGHMAKIIDDIMQPEVSENGDYQKVIEILKRQESFVEIFKTPRSLKKYLEALKEELDTFNFDKYYLEDVNWGKIFLGFYIKMAHGDKELELINNWENATSNEGGINSYSNSLATCIKNIKQVGSDEFPLLPQFVMNQDSKYADILINFFYKEKTMLVGRKELESISCAENLDVFFQSLQPEQIKNIIIMLKDSYEIGFKNNEVIKALVAKIFDACAESEEMKEEIVNNWLRELKEATDTKFGHILFTHSTNMFDWESEISRNNTRYSYFAESIQRVRNLGDDEAYSSTIRKNLMNKVLFEDSFLDRDSKIFALSFDDLKKKYSEYCKALFEPSSFVNGYNFFNGIKLVEQLNENAQNSELIIINISAYLNKLFDLEDFPFKEEPYKTFLSKLWKTYMKFSREIKNKDFSKLDEIGSKREKLSKGNKIKRDMFAISDDMLKT